MSWNFLPHSGPHFSFLPDLTHFRCLLSAVKALLGEDGHVFCRGGEVDFLPTDEVHRIGSRMTFSHLRITQALPSPAW